VRGVVRAREHPSIIPVDRGFLGRQQPPGRAAKAGGGTEVKPYGTCQRSLKKGRVGPLTAQRALGTHRSRVKKSSNRSSVVLFLSAMYLWPHACTASDATGWRAVVDNRGGGWAGELRYAGQERTAQPPHTHLATPGSVLQHFAFTC
jgi:hypothetical protein